MQRSMILGALGAVAMLMGCAADADPTSETLLEVDVERVTGEVLYYAPEISEVPFAATELAEWNLTTADAIPIRIEVFETTAVAWYAPEGEAIIGRDTIMALWSVTHVTPIDGRVEGGSDGNSTDTGVAVVFTGNGDLGRDFVIVGPTNVEKTLIDFADRVGSFDEAQAIEELGAYHPGCI